MGYDRLPVLVRFMIRHAANGMALGCAVLLLVSWLDIGGLGTLLASDASGVATAVLFFQMAMTFGAVSMAVAVMNLGGGDDADDDEDEDGDRNAPAP